MRRYMSKKDRPCDSCRKRKTGCRVEGALPCRLCRILGRECTFDEAAPERGRHSVGADGSMEGAGDMNGPQAGSSDFYGHDLASMPAYLGPDGLVGDEPSHAQQLPEHQEHFHPESYGPEDGGMPPGLFDEGRDPALSHSGLGDLNLDFFDDLGFMGPDMQVQNPSPAQGSEALSEHNGPVLDARSEFIPEALGYSAPMDPYMTRQYRFNDGGVYRFKQLEIHAAQQSPFPVHFLASHHGLLRHSRQESAHADLAENDLRAELDETLPRASGGRLLSLFQTFIAPQLPIFSTQALPDPNHSPVHLLAALYSLSLAFVIHDERLLIDLVYDNPPYAELARLINKSLAPDLHSPNIAVVQTLLLLVWRPPSNPVVSDSSYRWHLLGMLASASLSIGLNFNPRSWAMAPSQTALRARLSYAVYSTDKWLAWSLGRPPYLHRDNWMVTAPQAEDCLDSGLDVMQWTELQNLSTLSSIVDSALSRIFSLRSIEASIADPSFLPRETSQLLRDLHETSASLLPLPDQPRNPMLQTIHQLGHHYIKLIVLRAALRQSFAPNTTSPSSSSNHASRSEMRSCVEDFVRFLSHLEFEALQGFWPPWCQAAFVALCFTATLMVVSSPSSEECLSWIALLHLARKQIRLRAQSYPVLRLSLIRIDSFFWRGLDKIFQLQPHVKEALTRQERQY